MAKLLKINMVLRWAPMAIIDKLRKNENSQIKSEYTIRSTVKSKSNR